MTQNKITIIEANQKDYGFDFKSIASFYELMFFLAWRDIKVKYKQTILGALWVFLQPALLLSAFVLIFGRISSFQSLGVPYSIYALSGLLPWLFFANSVNQSSGSLISDSRLISKVYFPRVIVPLASVLGGVVDFCIGFILLLGLMLYFGHSPGSYSILVLPLALLGLLLSALSIGIWLAALSVRYRDFRYVVPYLMQFGMFATPVVYPASIVPEKFRWLLGLNPVAGIIEIFRWALLGTEIASMSMIFTSLLGTTILLWSGFRYFGRVEKSFADYL